MANITNKEKSEQVSDIVGQIHGIFRNEEKKLIIKVIADCVREILREKQDLSYKLSDEDVDSILEALKSEFGE